MHYPVITAKQRKQNAQVNIHYLNFRRLSVSPRIKQFINPVRRHHQTSYSKKNLRGAQLFWWNIHCHFRAGQDIFNETFFIRQLWFFKAFQGNMLLSTKFSLGNVSHSRMGSQLKTGEREREWYQKQKKNSSCFSPKPDLKLGLNPESLTFQVSALSTGYTESLSFWYNGCPIAYRKWKSLNIRNWESPPPPQPRQPIGWKWGYSLGIQEKDKARI